MKLVTAIAATIALGVLTVGALAQDAKTPETKDCGQPSLVNLDYLECQALALWESAEAKKEVAREYLASAERIRAQCESLEARSDVASCSMKSMDYEVEAGFLIQESKADAQKAEALADEYWRLKEGKVPTDEDEGKSL